METKKPITSPTGGIHRQIFASFLASIPALEYGQLIAWVSASLRLLQSPETPASAPLSDLVISIVASVLSFGAAFGTPFFSYATDRFGRKPMIMAISLLYSISWTLKIVSSDAPSIITARVIGGLASGGLFLVLPIYVREVCQDSARGALGVLVMMSYNMGVIAIYTLGMYVSYYQSLYICLATALTHFALFFCMPETPVYCIKKQRYDEAAKNLAWLRNKATNDKCIVQEIERLKTDELRYQAMPKESLIDIVKDTTIFRQLSLAIVILLIQPLSGNFAVVSFATSIFQRANTVWSPESLALFVSGIQLAGSLVSINTIERFGRKPLILFSMLSISLCMCTLGTWFVLVTYEVEVPGWIPVAAVCGSIFSYGAGLAGLPGIIMAEIFHFQHRARLAGIAIVLSWSASACVLLGFMPLANAAGTGACFYVFCASAAVGAAYVSWRLPETRGRTYEQIQADFLGKSREK